MGKSIHPKLLKKSESASAKHASAITKNLTRYKTLAKTLAGASTMANMMPRDYAAAKKTLQGVMEQYLLKVFEIIELEEQIDNASGDKKKVKDLEKKVKAKDVEADRLRADYGTASYTFAMLDNMVHDEITKALDLSNKIDKEWPTKDKL